MCRNPESRIQNPEQAGGCCLSWECSALDVRAHKRARAPHFNHPEPHWEYFGRQLHQQRRDKKAVGESARTNGGRVGGSGRANVVDTDVSLDASRTCESRGKRVARGGDPIVEWVEGGAPRQVGSRRSNTWKRLQFNKSCAICEAREHNSEFSRKMHHGHLKCGP